MASTTLIHTEQPSVLGLADKSSKSAYGRRNVPFPLEVLLVSPEPTDRPCKDIPTYEFLLSLRALAQAAKHLIVTDSQEVNKPQSLRRESDFWEVHKDSAAGQRLLDQYANFFEENHIHPTENLISKVYEPPLCQNAVSRPDQKPDRLNDAVQSLVALQGLYDPPLLSQAVRLAFPGAIPSEDADGVRKELEALKIVHLNLLKSYVEEKKANGELISQLKSQVTTLNDEYRTLKSELHEVRTKEGSEMGKTSATSSGRSHQSYANHLTGLPGQVSERDNEPQCQTIESVEIDCGFDSQSLPPGAKILETPRGMSQNIHLFAKQSIGRYNETLPLFQPPTLVEPQLTVNEAPRVALQAIEDPIVLAAPRYTVSEPMEFARVARATFDGETTRLLAAQTQEIPAQAFIVENQHFSMNPQQFAKDSQPAFHEETATHNVTAVTWENYTPRVSANLQGGPVEGTMAPRGTERLPERKTKVIRISLNDDPPVTNVYNRPPGAVSAQSNGPLINAPAQYIQSSVANGQQYVPTRYNPSAQFVNYNSGQSAFYAPGSISPWNNVESQVRRPSDIGFMNEGQQRWPNQPRHTFTGPIGYAPYPQPSYIPAPVRNGPVSLNVRVPGFMSHQRYGETESHVLQVTRHEVGQGGNGSSLVTNIDCMVPEPGIEASQRFASRVSNY